jgi:hypothetical protein
MSDKLKPVTPAKTICELCKAAYREPSNKICLAEDCKIKDELTKALSNTSDCIDTIRHMVSSGELVAATCEIQKLHKSVISTAELFNEKIFAD